MTPKQKADELIAKFKKITTYKYQEYAGANYSTFEHDIDTIKECALEVVNEIINGNFAEGYDHVFWLSVKVEIEAVK
jgi:hypothetical protein